MWQYAQGQYRHKPNRVPTLRKESQQGPVPNQDAICNWYIVANFCLMKYFWVCK